MSSSSNNTLLTSEEERRTLAKFLYEHPPTTVFTDDFNPLTFVVVCRETKEHKTFHIPAHLFQIIPVFQNEEKSIRSQLRFFYNGGEDEEGESKSTFTFDGVFELHTFDMYVHFLYFRALSKEQRQTLRDVDFSDIVKILDQFRDLQFGAHVLKEVSRQLLLQRDAFDKDLQRDWNIFRIINLCRRLMIPTWVPKVFLDAMLFGEIPAKKINSIRSDNIASLFDMSEDAFDHESSETLLFCQKELFPMIVKVFPSRDEVSASSYPRLDRLCVTFFKIGPFLIAKKEKEGVKQWKETLSTVPFSLIEPGIFHALIKKTEALTDQEKLTLMMELKVDTRSSSKKRKIIDLVDEEEADKRDLKRKERPTKEDKKFVVDDSLPLSKEKGKLELIIDGKRERPAEGTLVDVDPLGEEEEEADDSYEETEDIVNGDESDNASEEDSDEEGSDDTDDEDSLVETSSSDEEEEKEDPHERKKRLSKLAKKLEHGLPVNKRKRSPSPPPLPKKKSKKHSKSNGKKRGGGGEEDEYSSN
jgi:hypothetical protein